MAGLAQARRERGRLGSGGGVRAVSSRLRDEDDFAGKRRERSGEPPATTSSVHNGVNYRCAIMPLTCRKLRRVSCALRPGTLRGLHGACCIQVAIVHGARCCVPHALRHAATRRGIYRLQGCHSNVASQLGAGRPFEATVAVGRTERGPRCGSGARRRGSATPAGSSLVAAPCHSLIARATRAGTLSGDGSECATVCGKVPHAR